MSEITLDLSCEEGCVSCGHYDTDTKRCRFFTVSNDTPYGVDCIGYIPLDEKATKGFN